jgi:hypothetical protein
MAELIVGEELQDFLVAQGVGQYPDAAASTTVPSIWLAPRDGAPQPRKGENVTVTLIDTLQAPAATLEAWIEETFVDVIVTARQNSAAKLLHRVIRNLLHPDEAHGGRMQWMMGDLKVEYSTIWRGEQPLYQDDVAYSRTVSYRFGARRKALAGTPLVP